MTIAVLGNLCGLGGQLGGFLRSRSRTVGIATYAPWFPATDADVVANRRWDSSTTRIEKLATLLHELKLLGSARGIVSLTGSLSSREYHWLFVKMGLRPYVAFATGSDLRELARSDGREGLRARQYFKNARLTVIINFDPKTQEAVDALQLRRVHHFRFPMLPVISAESDQGWERDIVSKAREFGGRYPFNIYLAASQDFSRAFEGAEFGSCKGNDLAINAVSNLAATFNFGVFVRRAGPDADLAARMLSPIMDRVHFLPTLSRAGFHSIARMSDVVLDQFFVGTFGALALEAGMLGVPTLTYLHDGIGSYYKSPPPFLNARTSDAIAAKLAGLMKMSKDDRAKLGSELARWVAHEHSDRRADELTEAIIASLDDPGL